MTTLTQQFSRFFVIGIINTALDLIVLTILIKLFPKARQGYRYTLAKGVSFCVATINSYYLNKKWAFAGGAEKAAPVQFSEFVLASLVGLGINISVASLVNKYLPHPRFVEKYWPQISALFGTGVGLFWNFIAYKVLVFKA